MSKNNPIESISLRGDRLDEKVSPFEKFLTNGGLFGLGEACVEGLVEPENIEDVIVSLIEHKRVQSKFSPRVLWCVARQLLSNPQRGRGAFEVAECHYDLGNDLFGAMLDSSMSYTCGYWRSSSTLEESQKAKLDLICRKLQLTPGMRVLDIGCGFGNFAYYAAKNYGVEVVGLTVSKEQANFARQRCQGVPVQILVQDYRSYIGSFDRVVSIEMIEAVGRKNIAGYFQKISDCLAPQGLALVQVISTDSFNRHSHPALDQYLVWLVKYIFPNGYVPTHSELISTTKQGLVVEDIENFSADYERTLTAWRNNFIAHWPALQSKFDARFRRIWLYYLGGCIAFFRMRMVQLFQIVYAKHGVQGGYARI